MAKLEGMTFNVCYIEGVENVLADLMSRPYNEEKSSLKDFEKQLNVNALFCDFLANEFHTEHERSNLPLEPFVEKLSVYSLALVDRLYEIAGEQTDRLIKEYRIPDDKIIFVGDITSLNRLRIISAWLYHQNSLTKFLLSCINLGIEAINT